MTANAQQPVLVLDADQPAALAIVRALGRQGVPVQVAGSEPNPLAALSRHARRCLRYPDPLRQEDAFIAWLNEQTCDDHFGLVIPVTERTLVPILRQRAHLNDRRIAMAPSAALEQVLDKDQTMQLAMSLGVPVPRSVALNSIEDLFAAAAGMDYPVVVKPSRSVGQDGGQRVQLSVSYAHNPAELEMLVRNALRYGAVMLQEYFRGVGVGIELIADRGTVRYAFQHRRLHEVPLTGGGSSLRISEAIVPALRDASERLIRALGWHGVAMVEFKYAADTGEFRLIEINGRFWGSLPLAVAAGANFPLMLHELMTRGQVGDHPPARLGVVCRQLARDIDWLEHVLRRAAPAQLVRLPSWRQVLGDSLLVLSPRHHFDVQSLSDPWPGLVDLWRIVRRQVQRVAAVLRRRRRLRAECRAARPGGPGRSMLTRAAKVLFLCYGNINRSALAQAHAEARHGGRFVYLSAGFHAQEGRSADPSMVDAAARHGIDLRSWRSRTLTAQMVEQADVILVMELAHIDRLLKQHPAARHKTFLLGASGIANHGIEIPDPYGQAAAVYAQVCQQVVDCVDGWVGGVAEIGGDRQAHGLAVHP